MNMSTNTNASLATIQHRKPTKKSKTKPAKTNPIKVKYISSPMRVETSASQFRALVQELTGQDAEYPADLTRFGRPAEVADAAGKNVESRSQVTVEDDLVPYGMFYQPLDDGDSVLLGDRTVENALISGMWSQGWFGDYCSQVDLLGGVEWSLRTI